jgi:tetratricopeptide (TPR) repeat protein
VAALRYYQDFLRERSDDPSLRVETALAHERVGSILDELDRYAEALAEFDQSLALIEPLARTRPTDATIATTRIRLESHRVHAFEASGRLPEAITAFEQAAHLWEAEVAARGDTDELTDIMARACATASWVFGGSRRLEDAVRVSRQARELAELAVRNHPGDLAAARTYLDASGKYSEALWHTGRFDLARGLCVSSIPLGESLLRQHPRDIELRLGLYVLNLDLAEFERILGRHSERLERARKAAEIASALVREYPTSMRARKANASALGDFSYALSDAALHAEAERAARTAIELCEGLSREFPSNANFRERVALNRAFLGRAQLKAGKHAESLATIHEAVPILETSDVPQLKLCAAGILALASTITDPAEGPAAADRQRRDADRAVSLIRQAIEMGRAGATDLKTDPDFDSLSPRADYQALLMDGAFPADPFAP